MDSVPLVSVHPLFNIVPFPSSHFKTFMNGITQAGYGQAQAMHMVMRDSIFSLVQNESEYDIPSFTLLIRVNPAQTVVASS
jgi:hypothetical protein